jgi:hypothetical protein
VDPRPRLLAWGVIVGVGVFGAAVYVLDPSRTPWLPQCPFHYVTSLYCPGCGTMRGLHQLLFACVVASQVSLAVAGRAMRPIAFSPTVSWAIAVTVIVYGVARNVPCYPFCLLAPR